MLCVLDMYVYTCDYILHHKLVMCIEISLSQQSEIICVLTATWVIYETNCSLIGTLL